MASVAIRGVKKAFGPHHVIHGVDVEIADGEFVVLVGPSGCGKSTLLRMIAGLENISAGEIRIADRVVNALPPKQRDVAMVFQNYALYPHMTVADNMVLDALRGAPTAEIEERVRRAAGFSASRHISCATAPAFRRPAPARRHGPRHRARSQGVPVRRALVNLDAKLRVQMRTEIKALHQRLKTTTIYVTHDQIEAMTMADKIVVMHDGRVEQIGTRSSCTTGPATCSWRASSARRR